MHARCVYACLCCANNITVQSKDLKTVAHLRRKVAGHKLDYDCKKRHGAEGGEMQDAERKFSESYQVILIKYKVCMCVYVYMLGMRHNINFNMVFARKCTCMCVCT